jgi:hypothetical protein
MWANDDAFGVRDGVLVLSKRPSLKVERDRLVIGDGYLPDSDRKPHELRLTRAECARGRLRHVVMIGDAGWVSNAAQIWLRDVGCALSLVELGGNVVFATGPRGPDRPWLRRQQALVGVGVAPGGVEIARSLLVAKLAGQEAVLRLMGVDPGSGSGAGAGAGDIAALGDAMRVENNPVKMLLLEAQAGQVYWRQWENLPVSFARLRPGGFTRDGRWRESLPVPDHWQRFGLRASLLTGKGWRATDSGASCLDFVYALLRCEMTVALAAHSLDCGIGLFHSDQENRPSLALDAMEPVRPLADAYVASFLAQSSFLLRDFTQTSEGELRLSHPLRQHLGRCAAMFRDPCGRVANWLARAFETAGRPERIDGATAGGLDLVTHVRFPTAPPRLPVLRLSKNAAGIGSFPGPREGYRERPWLPKSCAECGKALHGRQKRFCSPNCATAFGLATQRFGGGAIIPEASRQRRIDKTKAGHAARRVWTGYADPAWYQNVLQPRLASVRPADIARALAVSESYSILIKKGRTPHPRHWPALAALAGVEMPAFIERCAAGREA